MSRKQRVWISLGVITLLLGFILSLLPTVGEKVYGGLVFPIIRWILSNTIGRLPLPGVTVFVVLVLFLFHQTAIKPLIRKQWTWKSMLGGILSTISALVFLFQFLWGFNYARPSWDKRLNIEISGMTAQQLTDEYHRATQELRDAAATIQDVTPLSDRNNRDHEASVSDELSTVLKANNFPLSILPRVRIVRPKGLLMRWNTAGIYVPFSGEGHVDAGMLPVQIPFTLAHEMAHGFGVTDEGDCNFLAYLACRSSTDPLVHFAGVMSYWRYVASEYRHVFPEQYKTDYEALPALVKNVLMDIRINDAKYPDLFPKLRNTVYDTYLKTQGIPDGLQSYTRVVQLVWAYEEGRNRGSR